MTKEIQNAMELLDKKIDGLPHNVIKKYADVIVKAKDNKMKWKDIVIFFREELKVSVSVAMIKDVYFEKRPDEKKKVKKNDDEKIGKTN